MKRIIVFSFVLLFIIIPVVANAVTPVQDPHAPGGELNLYQVVNAMMGTSFTSSAQLGPYEITCDGWWQEWDGFIKIVATYAGYNQDLYWENSSSSGFILSASTDGINYNANVLFNTTGGNFYLKDVTTGGTWYSLDSMNSDGQTHMVTYSFGNDVYIVGFEDLSGLGDKDYEDLVFKITYGAAPCCIPSVSDIPNQTIWVGDNFNTINLDNYVADCDHVDSQITWSCPDGVHIDVSITNRVATINYAPPNWTGSETITCTATDPDGHSDSDDVTFTVQPNACPIVSDIPNQTVVSGGSFAVINLDNYVHDPDNTDSQITWSWSGNVDLIVSINNNRVATISYPSGWMGSETITFTATDPHNCSDSDSAIFAVTCGTSCKSSCAVGGIVVPVNKFVLISP